MRQIFGSVGLEQTRSCLKTSPASLFSLECVSREHPTDGERLGRRLYSRLGVDLGPTRSPLVLVGLLLD
jgi:hypothetical protein